MWIKYYLKFIFLGSVEIMKIHGFLFFFSLSIFFFFLIFENESGLVITKCDCLTELAGLVAFIKLNVPLCHCSPVLHINEGAAKKEPMLKKGRGYMNLDRKILFPENGTIYVTDGATSTSQSPPVSNPTLLGNKHNFNQRGKKKYVDLSKNILFPSHLGVYV